MAADDAGGFLARWARLKRRAARELPAADPPASTAAPAPQLPPIDELGIDSDFRSFMRREVDEAVRRAALKKLFGDPHFGASDGLDVYADDYSRLEPLAAEVVARLQDAWRRRHDPAPDVPDAAPQREEGDAAASPQAPDAVDAEPRPRSGEAEDRGG